MIGSPPACPHCRTAAPRRDDLECPACGRPLFDARGQRLRPLDRDFPALVGELDTSARRWIGYGAVVAFVVAAAGILMPMLAGVALLGLQVVWSRLFIAAPYARHFSTGRRILSRCLSYTVVVLLGGLHGVSGWPVVGLVTGPAILAGSCWVVWRYYRWHLRRERDRRPVSILEVLALVVLVAAIIVALVYVGFLAAIAYVLFTGRLH